ncbi:DNA-binding protein HEXBP [Tanacetum coccineum]
MIELFSVARYKCNSALPIDKNLIKLIEDTTSFIKHWSSSLLLLEIGDGVNAADIYGYQDGCCKLCGGVTHLAKDCPNKGNRSSGMYNEFGKRYDGKEKKYSEPNVESASNTAGVKSKKK